MIEDDDSRLVFFSTDDFAEAVTVKPDAGDPFTLNVIYDAPATNTRNFDNRLPLHGGARPSGSSPSFRCRSSDFPKALAGKATVTIRGADFTVFDVQHDGTGMAHVEVKKKPASPQP
jgi:hypothetical protein